MSIVETAHRERGAITIHVAIALMALIAFSAFVVDYGVMWVSRRQAQNAADAGALAGAISTMVDGGGNATATLAAQAFAAGNAIMGEANSASNVDVTFSGPTNNMLPCGVTAGCVRVDVFRNEPDTKGTVRGNPIPTFFAKMVSVSQQGVRAR